MQTKRILLYILIGVTLLFICFGTGYIHGKKSIEIQTDTVEVEKIITEYKPKYTGEVKVASQSIKIPYYAVFPDVEKSIDSLKIVLDSLNKNNYLLVQIKDSLEIELQRVQRYYNSDNYEAWVSGVDPVLDSLKIKQQVQYITNTQVIDGEKFWLNVGLNANGWSNTSYNINPNVNLSYIWKRTTFTGEFGVSIPVKNTAGTIPYVQFGINYSLWSF